MSPEERKRATLSGVGTLLLAAVGVEVIKYKPRRTEPGTFIGVHLVRQEGWAPSVILGSRAYAFLRWPTR